MKTADIWQRVLWIARAGSKRTRESVTVGAATVALGLLLSLGSGGCYAVVTVDEDGDGYTVDVDCDDTNPDIHPGQPPESCCPGPDAVDRNCDGVIGPAGPEMVSCNCFYDADGDGYGTGFGPGPDCDDTDPTIYPGAPEDPCPDGVDQDCDGIDGDALACMPLVDADMDGYTADVDCNDTDATIHPGQPDEGCCPPRGTPDRNCDGVVGPPPDEPIACNCFYDEDGDGYGEGFGPGPDCNDMDPTIYPGAPEICEDGIDQDCDGEDTTCPPG